jgi:predicted phosphodiesterase
MKIMSSPAADIVKEVLGRFPDAPILTLAKKLHKENPKVYKNIEHARGIIRAYKGQHRREDYRDKAHFKEKTFNYNPFKLPESRSTPREVFKLPTSVKKVLLMGDVHFPYQDNQALTAALLDAKKENVDCIFINGDLLDFYAVSFHEKDPRKMDLKGELEIGREFFKNLRANFPKTLIYYIPGNHEYRIERYLRVKAPELLDLDEFRIDVLLQLAAHKINFITHGTKVYFGKLMVEHGDKMRGTGGVNPARTLFLRLKRHAACSHFHRTSENTAKVYDGDSVVTYSIGCLCELEPGYLEVNEHNHGHGIVEMHKDGFFAFRNKKIINGKVY